MFRRALQLTTLALAALTLAATPAFAGEDPDPSPPAPPAAQPTPTDPTPTAPVLNGSANLRASQGCMTANRAKASVSGSRIASVAFFVDGKKVETVTSPDASGRFTLTMSCAGLDFGTHRARAYVTFETGVSPRHRTLVFQITRADTVRPQFAG